MMKKTDPIERPNKYICNIQQHFNLHETKTQFKTRNRKAHNYTWGLQNYQQFIEQLDQKAKM